MSPVLDFSSSCALCWLVGAASSWDVLGGKHQGSFMPAKRNFHDELSTHLFCNLITSAVKKHEYVNGGQKVCALIRKLI